MIKNYLRFVPWKDKKQVVADLRLIYEASAIEQAELNLTNFAEKWGKYSVFFAYPEEIRRIIYTTNAIESLNMTVRKVLKNKRFFPSDDSASKQIFLAIRNISKRWTMPIRN